MRKIAVLMIAAALLTAVNAEVIFFDDFQAYPASDPANFSATGNWTWNGFGTAPNASRIYDTSNYGITRLWIASAANAAAGTGINSKGIDVLAGANYVFSAALVCETSNPARTATGTVDLMVGQTLSTATSVIGGPQGFTARGDDEIGGEDTYDDQMTTINFNSGTVGDGDQLFIRIAFNGTDTSLPFVGIDNVTVSRPTEPILVAPVDGAENQAVDVTLNWQAPDGGGYTPLGYNVYVARSEPNLTAALADRYSANQADLTYTPAPELEPGLTYYWRVEALEPNDVYPNTPIAHSSPAWSFSTLPITVVITTDPVSQTVEAGGTAVLTIEAMNAETYQWYKDGEPLTGETTDTLTLTDMQLDDEGLYTCTASNSLPSSATSAAAQVMVKRLVAHWTLDGTLEAIESNPAENWDGVYMNVQETPTVSNRPVNYVTGADGTPESAVLFEGGRVMEIPYSNDFFNFHQNGLTLTAWVLGPTGGDYRRFVNKNESYAGCQHNSYTIQMIVDGAGWVTAVPAAEATEGKWRFVAVTYNPTTAQRVVYGAYDDDDNFDILHATTVDQTITTSGTTNLVIGGASVTESYYNYLGSVDDVRIYNYPLNRNEIANVYFEMTGGWLCLGIPELDTNGPLGVPDCKIDLYEIVEYCLNWLECGLFPEESCF